MLSIDNSDALDYCKKNDNSLNAAVAFSYDAGAGELTLTDNTVYAAGDSRKSLNIEVYDKFGGRKDAHLGVPGVGNVNAKVVDVSTLNVSEGLSVNVTLVSAKGKTKDGSVHDVATLKVNGNVVMEK